MTGQIARSAGRQDDLLHLDITGPAAVPRKNGELVFETPWESRAFGIAVALSKSGAFEWEEFRKVLIENVKETEKDEYAKTHKWNYYAIWEKSLERLLLVKGIISEHELERGVIQTETDWNHKKDSHNHSHN
ncbi:MAG TPA: nitrile hydratase accessory protein [Nitrososphaerales archaeon]|nr:nitrile hydratase accessory protein [Nitrososphaerales archaeon]